MSKLQKALESDAGIMKYSYGRDDGEGRKTKVCLWNQPGNDITGIIARSQKMAGTFEKVGFSMVPPNTFLTNSKESWISAAHIFLDSQIEFLGCQGVPNKRNTSILESPA